MKEIMNRWTCDTCGHKVERDTLPPGWYEVAHRYKYLNIGIFENQTYHFDSHACLAAYATAQDPSWQNSMKGNPDV